MLNQMGDGGPFVFKEWDEAVASMAMCEEATFVFSVGATQRAMMPFVASRKAPPGTVLVVEVGLINVKRDGGRRQEVRQRGLGQLALHMRAVDAVVARQVRRRGFILLGEGRCRGGGSPCARPRRKGDGLPAVADDVGLAGRRALRSEPLEHAREQ